MIKNIIFDMGGVLMDFDPVYFVSACDVSESDKRLLLRHIFVNEYWAMLDWGYIDENGLFEYSKKHLPKRLYQEAEKLIYHWEDLAKDVPGTKDIVKELSDKGYNLYLLSNAGPRHKDYWHLVGGHEYFKDTVVSSYEKIAKPDIRIYEIACNRFGIKKEESIFIDNNIENLCGARIFGLDCMLFTDAKTLRDDLVEKGIL